MASRIRGLTPGLSESQIFALLGEPAEIVRGQREATLVYWYPMNPFTGGKLYPGQLPHWAMMEDGRLNAFGPTEYAYLLSSPKKREGAAH